MQNSRTKMERKDIYVLIACEESQAECYAFRELGFTAYSCDIQPVRRGGREDWHILGDVTPLLQGETKFVVMTGEEITVPRWDLIIAHPPCTYISRVVTLTLGCSTSILTRRHRGCRHDARLTGLTPSRWRLS